MTSIGVNIFIGEQFLSVILPGNAFKETYEKAGFDPTVLGRTLEDGGTVINYLVPWGIAGSFVASTFGIPTLTYLPFVFFSLLSPVFSMVSAFTGWGISKICETARSSKQDSAIRTIKHKRDCDKTFVTIPLRINGIQKPVSRY